MNGFWDSFAAQLSALTAAYENILHRIPRDTWNFGGGTALALFYLQHRRSYQLDLFVHAPA